jgi:hypothetical protein
LASDWRAGSFPGFTLLTRRLRKQKLRYVNAVVPRVHTSEDEHLRGENRVLLALNDEKFAGRSGINGNANGYLLMRSSNESGSIHSQNGVSFKRW